ncbi:glycerophosphodiester phosphodiesterase family protein [Candidatus Marinimicrobia bacterium]|nr:glycerophosphodiester phosphodiesterase family protein [Candidatus Neomarinimicrobiota bacterium]
MILVCFVLLLTVVSYLRYWRGRGMEDFYSSKPMLFSHRGVTNDYPENTLEAYKESEKRGFTGIELDIISSKDGVLYCSHNHQLEQETDSSGYIHQMISTKLDKIKNRNIFSPKQSKKYPKDRKRF